MPRGSGGCICLSPANATLPPGAPPAINAPPLYICGWQQETGNMKVGDYYVMTRHCRADGTIEFVSRTERATPDREQAAREARGNARRLAGDGRDFGVEVHEVLAVDGGGAGRQFASVYAIERARPAEGPTNGAASHQERGCPSEPGC